MPAEPLPAGEADSPRSWDPSAPPDGFAGTMVYSRPRTPVPPAAAGFAVGHGAGRGVAKALEAAGVGIASIRADDPRDSASELAWQIACYQPWFLAFGIRLGVSAIGYLREAGLRPRTVHRVSTVLVTLRLSCSLYFVLSMMLHWKLTR